MLARLVIWFVLFYIALKFIVRFVVPLLLSARGIQMKMKEANSNAAGFNKNTTEKGQTSSKTPHSDTTSGTTSTVKDDYIDFEEVR